MTDVQDQPAAAEPEQPEPERIRPDIVDTKREAKAAELAVDHREANAALDRATEAALAMPGVPGRDEFLALAAQARMLSMSGAAPQAIRDNPFVAFHVAMVGRDLGISPSAAAELIDVVTTKQGQRLSLSPQLINGQIRRLGLGSIIPVVRTDGLCVAAALRPGGEYDIRCRSIYPEHRDDCGCRGVFGISEFTWQEAQTAGLAGRNCKPGEHKKDEGKCGCNQGYITYPKRMLWWRAAGFCADDYFPEAGLGLYQPEALGAVVDEEGRPIDPSTAELPAGYEEPRRQHRGNGGDSEEDLTVPADPLLIFDLKVRIAALPEEDRATLKARWTQLGRLKGILIDRLPQVRVGLAEATLKGVEGQAKAKGYDKDAAVAAVLAALEEQAPASPESPPDADTGPEATDWPAGADETPEHPEPAQGRGARPGRLEIRAADAERLAAAVEAGTLARAQVEAVTGYVRDIRSEQVRSECRAYSLSPDGDVGVLRGRLAVYYLDHPDVWDETAKSD